MNHFTANIFWENNIPSMKLYLYTFSFLSSVYNTYCSSRTHQNCKVCCMVIYTNSRIFITIY